jgi:hypothetical protein
VSFSVNLGFIQRHPTGSLLKLFLRFVFFFVAALALRYRHRITSRGDSFCSQFLGFDLGFLFVHSNRTRLFCLLLQCYGCYSTAIATVTSCYSAELLQYHAATVPSCYSVVFKKKDKKIILVTCSIFLYSLAHCCYYLVPFALL